MKLYTAAMAPNPDRVRFFLQEKGAWDQIERVEVSIMKGEHKTPAYREVSPLAQVPALSLDNGVHITESRAHISKAFFLSPILWVAMVRKRR